MVEDSVRYHVNKKGNPGICSAKIKCQFGSLVDEHYTSKEEVSAAFEAKMSKDSVSSFRKRSGDEPMGLLPVCDRNINETSDAFYRLENGTDLDGLKHLAEFHYWHEKARYADDKPVRDEATFKASVARQKLNHTEVGKNYTGFSYIGREYRVPAEELENIDTSMPPHVKEQNLSKAVLPAAGEVRFVEKSEEQDNMLENYSYDSYTFMSKLSAREHNALAYWTSCGSRLVNSFIHGTSNPWGIQNKNVEDDDYFDDTEYMKVVDDILDKSVLDEPILLYRGLSVDLKPERILDESGTNIKASKRPNALKWAEENYPVGKEISFEVPVSTSSSPGVALRFSSSDITLEIVCSKAAPVGSFSAWGNSEREYIAPRTTKYRVVGIQENQTYRSKKHDDSILVIQLEQIVE